MKKTKKIARVVTLDSFRVSVDTMFICLHEGCLKTFYRDVVDTKIKLAEMCCPTCKRDRLMKITGYSSEMKIEVHFGKAKKRS